VEWGDVVEDLLPDDRLRVELTSSDDEVRRLRIGAQGRSWAERWERLEEATEPFRASADGGGAP
jgi:tRNA A37 threonylcarbamoyladenosine biosynthesis protein TsaE